MVRYSSIKEMLTCEELGSYEAFGIRVCENGKISVTLHDVFPTESEAKAIVDVFNREQLEITHLEQVIEGYLQYREV